MNNNLHNSKNTYRTIFIQHSTFLDVCTAFNFQSDFTRFVNSIYTYLNIMCPTLIFRYSVNAWSYMNYVPCMHAPQLTH